ncbi:hypothetical protein AB0L06_10530 [Spirillospora sp. NPDC052269]
MRTPRIAGLLLVPVLALGLAACGGGGSDNKLANEAAKKADNTTKMRDFAKCMREHGVNMKDPDGDGRITVMQTAGPKGADVKQQMDSAQKECQHFMPNGGKPRKASPEDLDKMRKFAQCMRQHGIDMQDPDPNGGLMLRASRPPGQGGEKGNSSPEDDPKMKAANQACQQFQPGVKK